MRIKNYHLEEVIFRHAQPPRGPELVEGARGTGGRDERTPQVLPREREYNDLILRIENLHHLCGCDNKRLFGKMLGIASHQVRVILAHGDFVKHNIL